MSYCCTVTLFRSAHHQSVVAEAAAVVGSCVVVDDTGSYQLLEVIESPLTSQSGIVDYPSSTVLENLGWES